MSVMFHFTKLVISGQMYRKKTALGLMVGDQLEKKTLHTNYMYWCSTRYVYSLE